MPDQIVLFCDGACKGNPGPGGWGAVALLADQTVTELGGREEQSTNNKMELTAAIRGLEFIEAWLFGQKRPQARIEVFCDSKYVIAGATAWRQRWKRNNWRKQDGAEIANLRHWQELDALCERLQLRARLGWAYVEGHAGIPGNERCDQIAQGFASGDLPPLFQGTLKDYPVDLSQSGLQQGQPEAKGGAQDPRFPLYLSWIDGALREHKTWADCQARVHGRPGARCKKVSSQSEYDEWAGKWRA